MSWPAQVCPHRCKALHMEYPPPPINPIPPPSVPGMSASRGRSTKGRLTKGRLSKGAAGIKISIITLLLNVPDINFHFLPVLAHPDSWVRPWRGAEYRPGGYEVRQAAYGSPRPPRQLAPVAGPDASPGLPRLTSALSNLPRFRSIHVNVTTRTRCTGSTFVIGCNRRRCRLGPQRRAAPGWVHGA